MKKKLFYIIYLISFVFIAFVIIELGLSYLIHHPEKCPKKWFDHLQIYYGESERSVIQYENKMAQYDSALFYTLKPGKFIFENSEFSTSFNVNSIGCRDDESSLDYPKIVMLGDSYGMGWGIEQNKTYASLVEKKMNISVLNMGISSYGTPREIEFLSRVNTDSMEYLIIQYCPNDYGEIAQYLLHNNDLVVSNEDIYDSIASLTLEKKPYYLFKRTAEFLPMVLGKKKVEIRDTTHYPKLPPLNIYKGFLEVIRSAKNIPKHTKIIVFTIGVKGFTNKFMESVKNTLDKEFGSSLHDQITFLDFSETLQVENYFVLDPHINTSGHQLIADTLVQYLQIKPKGFSEKKWYYDNGNISIHSSYFKHYKDGLTTYYWPTGNISMQTNYKKGEKHGEEIRYNEKGKEIERKTYHNGLSL